MNEPDNQFKELFIKAGNSMIEYLSPEELEAYAQAEQTLFEATQQRATMVHQINAGNLFGWFDSISDEEAAIIKHFPPKEQQALRIMSREELASFHELYLRETKAFLALSYLIGIAASRSLG